MSVLRVFIIVFYIVGELSNHISISNGKPAAEVVNVIAASAAKPFLIEKPLTSFAVGTLTSMVLTKLLYLDQEDSAQCALSIHNKLTHYRLINPYLFIVHGGNSMPVPLKIKTNSSEETTLEAVKSTGATSGLLFYEIEYVGYYLMIFWKIQGRQVVGTYVPNRFSVDVTERFFDDETWLKEAYNVLKDLSDKMQGPNEHFEIEEQISKSNSRPTVPPFKITVQAQMTMGKKAEFMVEIKDNLPPITEPQYYKRDFGTTLALAIIPLGLNLAFKKITSYIPSEQSCTISLENLSKDESLIKPSWYITAGEASNIVPWEIKSNEIGEITFVIPLGGKKIAETFKHTVYFLSYHINATGYDIVIGTWFPLKLETKEDSEDTQKETARYTVFIMKPPAELPMKYVLEMIGNLLIEYKDEPKILNEKLMLRNKAIFDLIAQTSLTNSKIQIVKAKKIQSYIEWQYPLLAEAVGNAPRREYHIKIVTAIGIGSKTGMVVKVEVVPGKSPASFAKTNPQIYKEQPETKDAETQFPSVGKSGTQDVGVQIPSQMKNAVGAQFPSLP